MENRATILKKLMQEIIKNIITMNKNYFFENDLKNYSEYFTKDEILEYDEKIEMLKYTVFTDEDISQEKWFEKNLDILIFFLKDIQKFFEMLKNKRMIFLKQIFKDCINSMENQNKFCKFVGNSEYYFENYKHYFSKKEIEKYNELWLDLEIENAVILSNSSNKWEENYSLIIEGIKKMLIFLIEII